MASSQVTSQVWPVSNDDNCDDEACFSIGGILEKGGTQSPSQAGEEQTEKEKKAHIWSCTFIEPDGEHIYRGSFTTCSRASKSSKAENADYITRANELSMALYDSIRMTKSLWGPACRTSGNVDHLIEAEESTFHKLVEDMPERYGDIAWHEADRNNAVRTVMLYDEDSSQGTSSMGDGSDVEEVVAGMRLVLADD
ncbi:hypothetical protein L198_06254 [Cryptococcus wingfieldii CBS 7118]|uniref:Uncharacterized protein n=1 Tax=Cryptococcus wingfieldii CBS 7118 TaxID=1295528 RepID=A0A1E3IQM5_9TREE|nr:hypothetical protein L198_06254 [Cryptococcus wingfieldii CBS 7118]ODN90236.1 hypothetical protein L198_06254 [Cryptococcus wingfieldii CBS 7118]